MNHKKDRREKKGETREGVLHITRGGKGFLLQENENDIPIPKEYLKGALSGDVVEVILSRGQRETIGTVKRIIERKNTDFVGVVKRGKNGLFVTPDDSRVYFDIAVNSPREIPLDHKVLISVTDWEGPLPQGEIREIIGKAGEHETEIRAIVRSRGFDTTFSDAILAEADSLYKNAWDEEEIKKREDFRKDITFTIDPDTAKDFDDAISFKEISPTEIEVGVHIADVSHFVKMDSLIDKEAYRRATSIYLVDRTIPMLPPQLSDDLCSLKPNEDRLTFSALFTIKNGTEVVGRRFTKGIIRSKRRFTYEEADVLLNKNEDENRPPLSEEDIALYRPILSTLFQFTARLRKKRKEAGAIMFDKDEIKPLLNDAHEVVAFKRSAYTESHQLIEELMLLANREVAAFVSRKIGKKRLFVYRTHDVPNQEKIEELATFLRAIGYSLHYGPQGVTGKDINALLTQIEKTPEEELIKTATVRSMAKAIYSTKNIGHYGLAFEYYAHFTSPIRRYPDLMVHRTLFSLLSGTLFKETPLEVEKRAIHSSEKEALAAQAERESIKMKLVEYFAKLIGQKRDGVVSGITEWGIYIEDRETGAEGMVRLATLTDDTYLYDRSTFSVRGEKNGRAIRLGDAVSYTVENVDYEERQITLLLA